AARVLVNPIELVPRPALVRLRFDGLSVGLDVDRRRVEGRDLRRSRRIPILEWIRRATRARHLDRIHPVGPEAQCPQEARRRDLGIHLAIGLPVANFQLMTGRRRARELQRAATAVWTGHEIAGDGLVWLERRWSR